MLYYSPDSLVLNKRHGELGEKTKSIFNPYDNPRRLQFFEITNFSQPELPWKRANLDDSNDTPEPIWVEPCQNLYCGLGLSRLILILSEGFGRAQFLI